MGTWAAWIGCAFHVQSPSHVHTAFQDWLSPARLRARLVTSVHAPIVRNVLTQDFQTRTQRSTAHHAWAGARPAPSPRLSPRTLASRRERGAARGAVEQHCTAARRRRGQKPGPSARDVGGPCHVPRTRTALAGSLACRFRVRAARELTPSAGVLLRCHIRHPQPCLRLVPGLTAPPKGRMVGLSMAAERPSIVGAASYSVALLTSLATPFPCTKPLQRRAFCRRAVPGEPRGRAILRAWTGPSRQRVGCS